MNDEKVGLSLRLGENTIEAVDETCAALGIKRSEFIRTAVEEHLEELQPGGVVVRRIRIPKKVYERLLFLVDKEEIISPEETIEQMIVDGTNKLFRDMKDEGPLISGLDQRLAGNRDGV